MFTAALSLRRLEIHGLTRDHGPVLVTGASGGVGSMSVALLASQGYEVVASTGKDREHPYLTGLGAAEVIGRNLGDHPGRVLGPERWAGAIDCVGGRTLAGVLRSLRYGAGVAASGLTGGNALETSVYPFIVRAVALLGIDSVQTPIAERLVVRSQLAGAFDESLLDDMAAEEIGLDGARPPSPPSPPVASGGGSWSDPGPNPRRLNAGRGGPTPVPVQFRVSGHPSVPRRPGAVPADVPAGAGRPAWPPPR